MSARPLIVHVLYRLDTGGMERVVVSLINATCERYRHAVVCLAGFGKLREEIRDDTIPCLSLDKRPGKDWRCHARFWRVLRSLAPDLVQTYNLGTLDLAPIVKLAGVRHLVHAEHGRDARDPLGELAIHRQLRRWMAPCITRHVAVSPELARWLTARIGIPPARVSYIANGIDVAAYAAQRHETTPRRLLAEFAPAGSFLIGNVARLDKVKDQVGLLRAFRLLRRQRPASADCRLVIVGEGSERATLQDEIARLGLDDSACLLGDRDDVAAILAECDVFALSSIAEGIPLTILEAMASGLPVVATDVGGVRDIVLDGATGVLVAPSDPAAMATALADYMRDPDLRRRHGKAGRARVAARFGMSQMVSAYCALYDRLLRTNAAPAPPPHAAMSGRWRS